MLRGYKVLEFQGLAPSVFCGMHFADQQAEVILVARPLSGPFSMEIHKNVMNRNKKCIKLSLKDESDRQTLIKLIKEVDIIIDPYRPGILEKEKLGPKQLKQINPKVILLRVTGYGQQGQMALRPGHDLNYIASSGVLKLINGQNQHLQFPANYLADFVSASLGITGTLLALKMRNQTQEGYVVDCSLAGGCSYLTILVQSDLKKQKQSKNCQIKYVSTRNKRYVATQFTKINNLQPQEILQIIFKMESLNQDYYKDQDVQIAEIKKINRIKETVLQNPFGITSSHSLSNEIPKRDENKEEIMSKLLKNQPKL